MKALFSEGEAVKVDDREQIGHIRTPFYIRGKVGRVVEVHRAHPNPERLAMGEVGVPYRRLYRVAFRQTDVWPGYRGARADSLVVDIYEHWLAPMRAGEERTQ